MEVLAEASADGSGKNLYMKGIFVQGGVKNANQSPLKHIAGK